MEKAQLIERIQQLESEGVAIPSWTEEMSEKVLQGVIDAALEVDKPAKEEKPKEKPAPKSKSKAAPKKKAAPPKNLRGVRDFNTLKVFLKQDTEVLSKSPTNVFDSFLYNGGRGSKLSTVMKKWNSWLDEFNSGKPEREQFTDLKTRARVKTHIRYREDHDGWVINRGGSDETDPVIKIIDVVRPRNR